MRALAAPKSRISVFLSARGFAAAFKYLVSYKKTGGLQTCGIGEGEESQVRFFGFSFPKAVGNSSALAFQTLLWSFGALEAGLWPSQYVDGSTCTASGNLAGQPLTSAGWSGVLLFLKGDLEFMCNDVGLPHWGRNDCCGLCMANKSDLNYKDLRKTASWRCTTHTPQGFRDRFGQDDRHPLLRFLASSGGPFAWALDTLHLLDYHGVSSHIIASVFTDIVKDDEFATGRQAASLQLLNEKLLAYYRLYKIHDRVFINLKIMNAEGNSEFPMLAGPAVKGATCRALVPFVASLTQELVGESRVSQRRAEMLQGLVKVQNVLETSGMFLTPLRILELEYALQELLSNYHYVAGYHMERGNVRYNVTFKFHYTHHLGSLGKVVNPNKLNTYMEESFLAAGARLYNHGAYAGKVQEVILKKYLTALQLRYAVPVLVL